MRIGSKIGETWPTGAEKVYSNLGKPKLVFFFRMLQFFSPVCCGC